MFSESLSSNEDKRYPHRAMPGHVCVLQGPALMLDCDSMGSSGCKGDLCYDPIVPLKRRQYVHTHAHNQLLKLIHFGIKAQPVIFNF